MTIMKETKSQTRVNVETEVLWRALSKDLWVILPKVLPNLVKSLEVLEGDGGPDSIVLIKYCSDNKGLKYHKKQIVDVDDTEHSLGLKMLQGGVLDMGFASYKVIYQLSAEAGAAKSTLVNIKVVYESEAETEDATFPLHTMKLALNFISSLGNYLLGNINE